MRQVDSLLGGRVRLEDASLRMIGHFYGGIKEHGADPAYYGDTVNIQDTDKVLMRWKMSDDRYRVIFGDLRIEDVSAEKLAQLEKIK